MNNFFKFTLYTIVLTCLTGCATSRNEKNGEDRIEKPLQALVVSQTETDSASLQKISVQLPLIRPYNGKYKGDSQFVRMVSQVEEIQKKTIQSLAERLAIVYRPEGTIFVVFRDYPSEMRQPDKAELHDSTKAELQDSKPQLQDSKAELQDSKPQLQDSKAELQDSKAELQDSKPQSHNSVKSESEDSTRQDSQKFAKLRTVIEDGKKKREILLVTESFYAGQENLQFLFSRLFVEAVIQEKMAATLPSLPDWFLQGAILYTIDEQNMALHRFARGMLEESKDFSSVLRGLTHNKVSIPDLEGYLFFLFLKDYFSEGEKKVKSLFDRVFWQGIEWERSLEEIFETPFFTLQEKARTYSLTYLESRYSGACIAYRKALRLYLKKQYIDAIPHFKRLLLQFPDSFMTANLQFWMAMCYYNVKQYPAALEYFHKIIEKEPYLCSYLGLVYYRASLCYYHQNQMAMAVEGLDNFIRDFPFHPFYPNAHIFLAESYASQSQYRKSLQYYERFIARFPNHSKIVHALEGAAQSAEKSGLWSLAKDYYLQIVSRKEADDMEKQQSREALDILEMAERNPPSASFVKKMDELVAGFAQKGNVEKMAILREIFAIGKMALPWISTLITICDSSSLRLVVASIRERGTPASSSHLLAIMKKEPGLSKECILALLHLQIPADFAVNMIKSELATVSPQIKPEIEKGLEDVLWNTSERLCQKFPEILRKLNGTPSEQIEIMEKLAFDRDVEQIPILKKFAIQGSFSVQKKAIQNLLLWKEPQILDTMKQLLVQDSPEIKIMAIEGLKGWQDYDALFIPSLLKEPTISVRIALISALCHSKRKEHLVWIGSMLGESDISIREHARKTLLEVKNSLLLSALAELFPQENHPIYFYMNIVQILEKKTGRFLSFDPGMTRDQRTSMVSKLLTP